MAANDKFLAANAKQITNIPADICIIKTGKMKQIETSISINKDVQTVWNKLMDFNSYPNWNPFVISISGEAIEDHYIKTSIIIGDKKPQHFKPKVLIVNPAKEFRWKGKFLIKGLFDGEHYFKLTKISENETRLVHGEKFSGILSGLILKMIKADTIKGFKAMNSALKNEVEQ